MSVNKQQISRISIAIVFLALIRIIGEFFRLDHSLQGQLTIDQLKPFMAGAMLCAVACFVMTILSYYARHTWIITIAVLTIIGLLVLKFMFIIGKN